jgi:hypothetical protein
MVHLLVKRILMLSRFMVQQWKNKKEYNNVYCDNLPNNQPTMEGRHQTLFVEVRRKLLRFLPLHYASPVIRIDNLPYMLGGIHLQFNSSLYLIANSINSFCSLQIYYLVVVTQRILPSHIMTLFLYPTSQQHTGNPKIGNGLGSSALFTSRSVRSWFSMIWWAWSCLGQFLQRIP